MKNFHNIFLRWPIFLSSIYETFYNNIKYIASNEQVVQKKYNMKTIINDNKFGWRIAYVAL